jgi:tRNA wybutosine-synthesizing protein 1
MALEQAIPEALRRSLRRQKYHLVGAHSAVKKCRWLHQSLVERRSCYKERFYGISSHRCLQMTPSVAQCTLRCKFCWRTQPDDLGVHWDEMHFSKVDDPREIVEDCLSAQRKILSGYKVHARVDKAQYAEALSPKHAAISLAGEPTLFPRLGELIREFHKRGLTTFLVTNGTLPEAIDRLEEEPTQLYVSLSAPDEETFREICRPHLPNAWERINTTLELLRSVKCPTVLRLTLARNLNLKRPERYSELVEKANPTYVEPKAYMFVGSSRLRLSFENMPRHEEIRGFAEAIAEQTGYNIIDDCADSRVVLLSRLSKPIKLSRSN